MDLGWVSFRTTYVFNIFQSLLGHLGDWASICIPWQQNLVAHPLLSQQQPLSCSYICLMSTAWCICLPEIPFGSYDSIPPTTVFS